MPTKRNLTEGSIWKALVLFALPVFLGQVFQQLYNAFDAWCVGFLYTRERKRKVDSQMARSVEHTTVLKRNSDLPRRVFDVFDRFAVLFAPFCAVKEYHISSLRTRKCNTLKVIFNVVASVVNVFLYNLAKLVHPLVSLVPISTEKRVH